jgi:hypothetical protein
MTSIPDRRTAHALAGLALACAATPALAADVVNVPNSFASANVFGPYVGGQTTQVETSIRNGVGVTSSDPSGIGSRVAEASPDGWYNSASVASITGNSSVARADLRAGTVKAVIGLGLGPVARGFAEARIADTVYFNNTSGSTVALPFSFRFDGSISDPRDFGSTATATFSMSGALGACPGGGFGTCFGDYGLRLLNGGSANQTTIIGYASNGLYNGVQQGGAFFFNAPDNVDLANYTVVKDWGTPVGTYDTIVSSTLLLPAGESRFGFDLRLLMDCSEVTTVCNFGQTGAFGFGALPDGLSFTSASGVFLVPEQGPGGVPEPASWAMLVAGFGLVGATMRKRRMAVVSP